MYEIKPITNSRLIDITGQVFERLTVIGYVGNSEWLCACSCGNTTKSRGSNLRNGNMRSCGCLHKELLSQYAKEHLRRPPKHGMKGTREYRSWANMKRRCYNPRTDRYPHYGGRGIVVCERWRNSFENFYTDMGECPDGYTLDRIDVDGNYEPINCRWASADEQARNRSNNVMLHHNGKSMCLTDWAQYLGIEREVLRSRMRRGLSTSAVLDATKRGWVDNG